MTLRFALPDVGEGLHEAEIVRWLVAEGDTVTRDQPLVEILTDKAQVELPSPAAGVVRTVSVAEGTVVPVGTVLVEIDDGSAAAPAGPASATPASSTAPSTPAPAAAAVATPGTGAAATTAAMGGGRPKASPSTRKLAASLGVDLRTVVGSGPGGRILATDVEAAAVPTGMAAAVPVDRKSVV